MRYAFIRDGIVVQLIVGDLSERARAQILADYRVIFGAQEALEVDDDRAIWIGGSYDATSGEFSPPPSPEPEPPVVDGTSEVIVEETTNDDAPIE